MDLPSELLEIIIDKKIYIDKNVTLAIKKNLNHMLPYICKNEELVLIAIEYGNLAAVQWFYKYFRLKLGLVEIATAVKYNQFEILLWFSNLNKIYLEKIISTAAKVGNTYILEKFLGEHPKEFNSWMIEKVNNDETLQWLFDHCSRDECNTALSWRKIRWTPKFIQWVREKHPELEVPNYLHNINYVLENKRELDLRPVLCQMFLPESVLEKLVGYVDLSTMLKTQKLSREFIKNYVLNEDYHQEDIERSITMDDIQYYQGYTADELAI